MMEWLLDYNCSRGGEIQDVMGYRWHEYGLSARFFSLRMYGSPYTICHLGPVHCTHLSRNDEQQEVCKHGIITI